MTAGERQLLLAALADGGALLPGYVEAGLLEDELVELWRRGWFVQDELTLTETGATVAAGLTWREAT